MDNKLIIDCGMHLAEDTTFYLKRNFNVVAIDADPMIIEKSKTDFKQFIDDSKLKILNYAIYNEDDFFIDFYISKNSIWNSLNQSIANRNDSLKDKIKVKTQKLSTIIKNYGVPIYCKIDIEGYDNIALDSLKELSSLPKYISVESECLGDKENYDNEQSLMTLNKLYSLGYRQFKLIDQYTLSPLEPKKRFYNILSSKINLKFLIQKCYFYNSRIRNRLIRYYLRLKFDYKFPYGASGPFGTELRGNYFNYETAQETLIFHKTNFLSLGYPDWGFWCDWHAK
jgi:FkbM family methyltransferase